MARGARREAHATSRAHDDARVVTRTHERERAMRRPRDARASARLAPSVGGVFPSFRRTVLTCSQRRRHGTLSRKVISYGDVICDDAGPAAHGAHGGGEEGRGKAPDEIEVSRGVTRRGASPGGSRGQVCVRGRDGASRTPRWLGRPDAGEACCGTVIERNCYRSHGRQLAPDEASRREASARRVT